MLEVPEYFFKKKEGTARYEISNSHIFEVESNNETPEECVSDVQPP